MKIQVGKTLKQQPKEFVDMVTNTKPGDLFIMNFRNQIIFTYDKFGIPQDSLFLVESLEDITTRFGSRDRILRGWRCSLDKNNEKLVKIEKTSKWCSQLQNTDPFIGKILN